MSFQIISEAAIDSKYTILEENMIPGTDTSRLIFRAILQEANVANNNKRIYPQETLLAIVQQLRDKARERKLLGELDHPQPQGDSAAKMKRSSTILLQNVCVVFRKLDFVDGHIVAECETLNTDSGRNLYNLLKDNISIGFSLRAFGDTRRTPEGLTEVLADGLNALTFDVVANPSHSNAVITEFLTEGTELSARKQLQNFIEEMSSYKKDLNSVSKQPAIIEESKVLFNSLEESQNAFSGVTKQVCINGLCMARPIEESIDYLIDLSLKTKKTCKIK